MMIRYMIVVLILLVTYNVEVSCGTKKQQEAHIRLGHLLDCFVIFLNMRILKCKDNIEK